MSKMAYNERATHHGHPGGFDYIDFPLPMIDYSSAIARNRNVIRLGSRRVFVTDL